MNCSSCGQPIPQERLAVLPNTTVCVACSDEQPRRLEQIDIDGASSEDLIHVVQWESSL